MTTVRSSQGCGWCSYRVLLHQNFVPPSKLIERGMSWYYLWGSELLFRNTVLYCMITSEKVGEKVLFVRKMRQYCSVGISGSHDYQTCCWLPRQKEKLRTLERWIKTSCLASNKLCYGLNYQ